MRNAIGLACAIAAIALVGVDGHSGLAQEQAKMKLAPPQVFQPPFPYSLGIVAQGKRIRLVGGLIGSSNCCTEGHFPRLHGQAIVQGFFLKERSVSLVPNAAQLAHFR